MSNDSSVAAAASSRETGADEIHNDEYRMLEKLANSAHECECYGFVSCPYSTCAKRESSSDNRSNQE